MLLQLWRCAHSRCLSNILFHQLERTALGRPLPQQPGETRSVLAFSQQPLQNDGLQ